MAARRKADSIRMVERIKEQELEKLEEGPLDEEKLGSGPIQENDSVSKGKLKAKYGHFAKAADGEQKFYTLENDVIKLKISSRGGKIFSVQLKEYKTHNSLPLILFQGDSNIFDLELISERKEISTNDLYFQPVEQDSIIIAEDDPKSLSMRLYAGENRYIEYVYTLQPGKYMLDYDINFVGMDNVLSQSTGSVVLNWQVYIPSMEKGWVNEDNYTTIYYKPVDEKVDNLSGRASKEIQEENILTRMKWIAFKHQFFSAILLADNHFQRAYLRSERMPEEGKYLKVFTSRLDIPYVNNQDEYSVPLSFYLGPNHFQTLNKYDHDLERVINLGGAFIRPINRWLIIPVFNFLNNYIGNYGIIILLLTIFIKMLLLPLTYRSYISQAKMRSLKPQIDELNKKIPKEKAMERQQATMGLYKKVGVNPMGGCLITILQFPILFAMFRFFPTSIELRQEGFLWANDLSSYDSILDLPFSIPWYGDHVSLFTILMTITTILSIRMTSQATGSTSQMPGMKTMMYIMPVMFMFLLNSWSSGLTYYYFLANLITLGQNFIFGKFVNEEELLKKLNSRKAKPVKKSGFQARLEKMARERGYQPPKPKKK